MIIIKIIYFSLQTTAFSNVKENKIIEITSLKEVEKVLENEKVQTNDLILLNTGILFDFSKRKKDGKSYESINKQSKSFKEEKPPLLLKNEEYKNIVNNYIKKYPLFILLHKGLVENIFYFTENSQNKILLPVKISRENKQQPVLIGNVLYGCFVKEEILIVLLNFYKQKSKRVFYITYGNPIIPSINSFQEIIIISLKDKKKY
jgi:hypothetical protein